ncbi:MAG: type IV pilus modification protein PilV [Azonexus sp.]|nr:type IV pilus modification protein PilV [Azonexus sp.]
MKQRGMSLIEVMVAVVVLASGLLGLGALQSRSLAMNQSAHYRSIAADLAADLADRIRANRTPFYAVDGLVKHPDLTSPPNFANCPQNTPPDTAPVCTSPSYLVATEMADWNLSLRSQLPDGRYVLTQEAGLSAGFFRYRLTLSWSLDRDASADASFSTFITVIE